jgi:ribose transport system permease protein
VAVPHRPRRSARQIVEHLLFHYAIVWALVVLAIVSNILYPGFFEIANLRNILSQNAPVGLVAIGMTFVMIAGGFDLSVSAIFAAAGVCFAKFAGTMPLGLAFTCALLIGIGCGAVNGLIVTRLRVNPFVATLGSASVFSGLAYLYSNSAPIVPTNPDFLNLGNEEWFGVPASIVIFAGVFAIGTLVLAKSVFGRSVYAVGGNAEAARLAGMRIDLVRFTTYAITGGCAALGGMIIASRTGVGQANVGELVTLDSIAMVIIGGTSLLGGEGAMWRTLVGLLILATINNLFNSLALDTAAQAVVKGMIVIAAVALDSWTRRRRAASVGREELRVDDGGGGAEPPSQAGEPALQR